MLHQSEAATTALSLIATSSTVCGCVHCTTSDSHSRKFPACAHTYAQMDMTIDLLQKQFTLQAHCPKRSEGSPYLALAAFCMVTVMWRSHTRDLNPGVPVIHSSDTETLTANTSHDSASHMDLVRKTALTSGSDRAHTTHYLASQVA